MNIPGLFGKLPAHGDFVSRRLPKSFISVWDTWLQCSVAGSQELLSDDWLNLFLTGSVWRFSLRPGVIDESAWAGVLIPSVDSVGRYFPLTIACDFDPRLDSFDFIATQSDWYDAMESIGLKALYEQLTADQILVLLDESAANYKSCIRTISQPSSSLLAGGGWVLNGENMASHYIALVRELSDLSGSLGIWFCEKTDNSDSQTFIRKGLPDPREYAAMISGRFG